MVSTDEALQHAYLFETTSEGILTRDTVPGSCVLYVRDTSKNIIVWTRSDPNDTEEAIVMDAPPSVEESPGGDDGIFPESFEGAPAPLSGGLETDQITKEEIAPGIVKPELPAILDSTASDMLPEEEPILGREEQRASPISRKREVEEVIYDYDDDDEEQDLGAGVGEIKEEIVPQQYDATPHQPTATLLALPPAPHRGGQYRACPHCGARHIVGQMLCLSCGVAIIKPSSQKQRKRVRTARWFAAEAASQAAGKPKNELSIQEILNEMRRDYSTSRGSQSLDGEALDKAKQQLKQAQKRGFSTIIERFDNDVDFTLHSVAGGFDREFLLIEDVLTHSALPNLGRSQEQRTLGVGAYGGGHQSEMARNEAIARVLYMHDVNLAALRAGLIDAVTDLPFCIMWLGGTYSIRKFVDVFLQHKIAQQLVTFTGVPIHLDCTAGYTAEQWHQWIIDRLRDQTAVARRAYDEKLQAAERSRKAQLEADARREQSQQWQSRGPHPYGRSSYGGSSGRWR